MSKRARCLTDDDLARFIAGLERETVELVYPDMHFGERDKPVYQTRPPAMFTGGIRLCAGANDLKAIIEENAKLLAKLERWVDAGRAKVSTIGGKLTVAPDGTVTIEGGSTVVRGPVCVEGVQ